jgi:hypothetical protein
MNLETGYRYISYIYESSRQGGRLDERSFDVLEQFIWEKNLSAYQIHSKLKSTPKKLAYKNVNKKTNTLLSSGLIQKVEADSTNSKHNAIPYRLTEYGIYQLFLNRLRSIAPSRIEVENSMAFLDNYSDSALFEIFVYPYFKKKTLLVVGHVALWPLYRYLSTCCHGIQSELKSFSPSWFRSIFSWNGVRETGKGEKVPGKDNERLLKHLQRVFELESIDRYDIKKEDANEYSTITVNITTPSLPSLIMIRLNKMTNKVSVMSTVAGQYKELQYEVRHEGQEILVDEQMPKEFSSWFIIGRLERGIEQIIYEIVCQLASKEETRQQYYTKILSQDDRFMKSVQEIYENRQKNFERVYHNLMNCN